jgi:hypothetical protein
VGIGPSCPKAHGGHTSIVDERIAPFDPEAFDPADFVHQLRDGRLGVIDD